MSDINRINSINQTQLNVILEKCKKFNKIPGSFNELINLDYVYIFSNIILNNQTDTSIMIKFESYTETIPSAIEISSNSTLSLINFKCNGVIKYRYKDGFIPTSGSFQIICY